MKWRTWCTNPLSLLRTLLRSYYLHVGVQILCTKMHSCWPRDTLYPLKLALTSPISGGRSVGIVLLRTKAIEFFFMHSCHREYVMLRFLVLKRWHFRLPITVAARSEAWTVTESRVRLPLEALMSVCVYSVFVLSCVQTAALRRTDLPSKESYWQRKRSRNWKRGQGSTKGCRAIGR
jgi:phosphoribosyl-AMP cyclohydrolase